METYLKQNPQKKFLEIQRDEKNVKSQTIRLAVGMPVICHTTSKKKSFLNSERFVVKAIDSSNIELEDIDDTARVEVVRTNLFNKFFYLGFAITYHASQGKTFREPYTIWDWGHHHVDATARYVALSRATKCEYIQIRN